MKTTATSYFSFLSGRRRTGNSLGAGRSRVMPEQSLNLLHVEPGRPAVILEVTGSPQLRARLNELGFTPGVTVSLVAKVSFGGPLAFRLRDTTVALRRTDAACVLVTT